MTPNINNNSSRGAEAQLHYSNKDNCLLLEVRHAKQKTF